MKRDTPILNIIIMLAIIVGMAWSLSKVGELMLTFADK
jgi:hypothetical protein